MPALGTEADKTRPGFTFFRIRAKSDGHTTISIADKVGYVFGLSETGGFHILASGRETPEGAERAREKEREGTDISELRTHHGALR